MWAGFPGFVAVVCTIVSIVMESTLKKRARAGFIINFVILLFLGSYTIYLAKFIHRKCGRRPEDAEAGIPLESGGDWRSNSFSRRQPGFNHFT